MASGTLKLSSELLVALTREGHKVLRGDGGSLPDRAALLPLWEIIKIFGTEDVGPLSNYFSSLEILADFEEVRLVALKAFGGGYFYDANGDTGGFDWFSAANVLPPKRGYLKQELSIVRGGEKVGLFHAKVSTDGSARLPYFEGLSIIGTPERATPGMFHDRDEIVFDYPGGLKAFLAYRVASRTT